MLNSPVVSFTAELKEIVPSVRTSQSDGRHSAFEQGILTKMQILIRDSEVRAGIGIRVVFF